MVRVDTSWWSVPNAITAARLALTPVLAFAILDERWVEALLVFAAAGASDGLDGFLARRFSMRTELGAFLDPLADKALMATVYLSSAAAGATPWGLTALVVGRDLLIVAAIAALWAAGRRVAFRPLAISKANTAAQILYAAGALAVCAFGASAGLVGAIATIAMGALTVLSFLAYLVQWSRGEADAA